MACFTLLDVFVLKKCTFYIVQACCIWLIFPFYHNLFLYFMFLYLSFIKYTILSQDFTSYFYKIVVFVPKRKVLLLKHYLT